jgi:RNA polymerase sigma factor (sigma-70 family)
VRIRLGPRLRGTVESVDVAQDVLRIACEELASLEASSNANILQWLSAVVENRLRTLNRRANAGARALDHAVPLEEPVGGQAPAEQLSAGMGTPSLALRRRETQALIDACIHELPEAEREVLILREYHGAEWSVVRERLGRASIHAAQQLHQRAKEHLRRKLAARLR